VPVSLIDAAPAKKTVVAAAVAKNQVHAQAKKTKRHNMHLENKPSDEMDLLITTVNEADLGWKADVCKYQKSHALYGSHCGEAKNGGLSLAQTDSSGHDLV